MARKKYTTRNAYRTIERIEDKAQARAEEIALALVEAIHINAPEDPLHEEHTGGVKLKDSFYVRQDPETGDFLIRSRRRYWAYQEFGTRKMAAQPYIRPALDAVKRYYA